MNVRKCRFCQNQMNKIFVDLGYSPLANTFLRKNDFKNEKIYPLCTYFCENCFLVQLEELETPKNIFSEYAYFSSFSSSWLKHAKDYVEMIIPKISLDENSYVVEIASNDGYLLQNFVKKNISVLGIEPAENVAKSAITKKIPTLIKFFNSELAKKLVMENKSADLIIGNNVLAHVPDLNDFVKGLKILLKSNGIITIEIPHLLKLIQQNQFDTIYHEHFSYFSLFVLIDIFNFHKLRIFDVEELSTHGGSLRVYATHVENSTHVVNDLVDKLLKNELEFGITQISTYTNFQKQVTKVKNELCEFITSAVENGKKIVCYGAAAKGNTLLNYCDIKLNQIDYVVDRSSYKQGLYLPGIHIPIKSPEEIRKTKPDYLLILPWNLKDEIMNQMNYIKKWGGKFVIPIPKVKIFS